MLMRFHRIAICLTFYLVPCFSYVAASNLGDIYFRTISPRGGFTNRGVEEIIQDHLGFIWIATPDGLYRYDGYEYRNYVHSDMDSTSISHDEIRDLLIDMENRLWVSTEEGLNLYNRATDGFERIYPGGDRSVGLIRDLESDSGGNLLIGTNKGIIRYNHSNGSSEIILLPYPDIRKIQMLKEGDMIVAFVENGIYQVSPSGAATLIIPAGESSLRSFLLTDNRLYLGYETGGVYLHERSGNLIAVLTAENDRISHNKINSIIQDSDKNIWIGTYLGLDIIDSAGRTYRYTYDGLDPYSLPYSSVYGIYEDPANNFWIGTWSGGLAYYNRYDNKFEHERKVPGINSISDNYVSSFTVDRKGDLWIGTERGGLNRQQLSNGMFTQFRIVSDQSEPLNIKSLLSFRNDRIFIGTYKQGVYYLDERREPHRLLFDGMEPGDERIYSVLESDSGLWIGDFTHGLYHISSPDFSRQVNYKEGTHAIGTLIIQGDCPFPG